MAGRNRKSVRRIRAGVAALVAFGLLGSSGGVAASASAATTGVQYKGTISLMNFGPYTLASGANVVFDTPEALVGAQAAAAEINAAGGINGYKVKIVSCDTQGLPNGALTCAQQAVSDHVVAVVGAGIADSTGISVGTLQAAGIPDIGDLPTGTQATNPISFPLSGGVSALLAGEAAVVAGKGVTSESLVLNAGPAVAQVPVLLKPVFQHFPSFKVPVIPIPATAVDLSSVVAQAEQSPVIGLNTGSTDSLAAFMTAYKQSGAVRPIVSNAYSYGPSAIAQVGTALSNGITDISDSLPSTYIKDPGVATYDAWMKKTNKHAQLDLSSAWAYSSVFMVEAMAHQLNSPRQPLTSSSLLAALNATKLVVVPLFPPMQFQVPSPDSAALFPRVFQNDVVVTKIVKGKLVATTGQFVDAYTGIAVKGKKN
jgi:ABC-type branched-subunit amino acid transport system substrate-binding protein